MPPKKKAVATRSTTQTRFSAASPIPVSGSTTSSSSFLDDWAPPDVELGISLSQVLQRSARRHKGPIERPPPLPKKAKRQPAVTAATPDTLDTSNPHAPKLQDEIVIKYANDETKDIAAMFTDDRNAGGDAKSHGVESADDSDSVKIEYERGAPATIGTLRESTPHTMEFIDEECARNYQRIVENTKEKQRLGRAAKRMSRRLSNTRIQRRLVSDTEDALSTDELPENPLEPIKSQPALQPSAFQAKKRPRVALQISDSEEATDDSDALDKRAIIQQRLRRKQTPTAMNSRFERARINAQYVSYDTDSENDIGGAAHDSIESADSFADILVDIPRTDTESDSKARGSKKNAVLVINDSSDDDFVSDPEEPAQNALSSSARDAQNSDNRMGQYLLAFEPRRREQMLHKLELKSGKGRSPKALTKRAKLFDSDLDDDIVDFIVDDEDANEAERSSVGINHSADSPGAFSHRNAGDDYDDNRNFEASSTFGHSNPRRVMSLMPEQFNQLDLHTSFKAYVQYLVYWICNGRRKPAMSEKNAHYFFQAYITVVRVVDSVEQSLVASSVWVDGFRNNLYGYPGYNATRITGTPGCDACHFHQNRMATFCVALTGTPYNRGILAPPQPGDTSVLSVDNSSSEEESSRSSNDSLPNTVSYNVGRVCKLRSELCHELHHFLYRLSYGVEVSLRTLSYNRPDASRSNNADLDEIWNGIAPDDLVEMLESQGRMDVLYADFKSMVSRSKSGFVS
ncbi:hypothetical protein BX661DRAFT_179317 [Kickxella alabastrina]|uniref:uncharacterized protein n=1 Tax=Kickxella alabastrina TaxID=61397 RepID=UPI00221EC2BB|nr:uncharacterized protein BX661DRAFT_179317 [Kickxella alabastrina]KAI7833182.1 hypothetical protein BX661DRAFT_179317 [Kickxella alabastrina]